MTHPVVQKPILEPTICRDGSVDYTTSNLVDPLVSFDQVREFYDEQAKSLRTVLDEVYNSISKINSSIETFQSTVDRNQESFILLQRTVNSQLDNMKHQIDSISNQTNAQLSGFSDRMDHMNSSIDSLHNLIDENKTNTDDLISIIQKQMKQIQKEMDAIKENHKSVLSVAEKAEQTAQCAKESVEMVTECMIPKLEKDILCKESHLNDLISAEVERATKAENGITDQMEDMNSRFTNADEVMSQNITSETQRAMGEEMKLLNLIKSNGQTSEVDLDTLKEKVDFLEERANENAVAIAAEIDTRAIADDTIRNSISAETTRATNKENELKEEIQSLTGSSTTVTDMIKKETEDRIQDVNSVRESYKSELKDLEGELDHQITSTETYIRSDLSNAIASGLEKESSERMSSDQTLADAINTLTENTVSNLNTVNQEINRINALIADMDSSLANRITGVENSIQSIVDQLNNTTINDQIKHLEEMVDFLKLRSDQFDSLIDEKITRQTAILIDKVETLDNRLDAEMRHSRAAEKRLSERISVLEGNPDIDFDDNDESDC